MNASRTFAAVCVISLAGALTLGLADQTAAAAPQQEWEARVSYADLRLEREADARTLLRRITVGATRVCGGPDISLARKRALLACRDEAVAGAVRKVGSPMLTAVHSRDPIAVLLARR